MKEQADPCVRDWQRIGVDQNACEMDSQKRNDTVQDLQAVEQNGQKYETKDSSHLDCDNV